METVTQPPIISLENLPLILLAIGVAVFMLVLNNRMSKKVVKH